MRTRILIIGLLLLLSPILYAGELLDRIVVTVNGNPVLQSDWDEEVRYESFTSGRSLGDLAPADRQSALDRIIDQELLREQMRFSGFKSATAEEINAQLETLKNQLSKNRSEAWDAVLASYGMTEAEIKNHIELELNQLRLIDARLRPSVQIDSGEVQTYYREKLLPNLAANQTMTLREAAPKIRELLIQGKINELLNSWLTSLRTQAQIHHYLSDSSTTPETGKVGNQ